MNAIKSQSIETINGVLTVNVVYDECAESPREWDNLGTIYSNSRSMNYDGHDIDEILKDDAEYIQDLKSDFKRDNVYYRIDCLDHSCIALSLAEMDQKGNNYGAYYMGLDCATFGVIAVSKEKIRHEYGCKRITAAILEKVHNYLAGEIADLEAYINGRVYGYEVEDESGDVIDSCYGYYDIDEALADGLAGYEMTETGQAA